jgi:hypothetical protein
MAAIIKRKNKRKVVYSKGNAKRDPNILNEKRVQFLDKKKKPITEYQALMSMYKEKGTKPSKEMIRIVKGLDMAKEIFSKTKTSLYDAYMEDRR